MGRFEGARKIEGGVVSPPKEKKPRDKKSGEWELRRGIGKRYDDLLAEREHLQEELKKYNPREYGPHVFSPEFLLGKELMEISASWLEKVRKETDFLKPLDSLGIEIFSENLEQQPNFPEEKIIFGSKEVMRRRVTEYKAIGGYAEREKPTVQILETQPGLRNQLSHILLDGKLDTASGTLIHELIHRRHLRANKYTNSVLTEAQAYFSGIYETGSSFSIAKIVHVLSEGKNEGGLYGFDEDQIVDALRTVASLYGLGLSYDEVSDLITKSNYDWGRGKFVPLGDVAEKLLKRNHIDEIDSQALDDLYRLHAGNERLKAQLLLVQTINEHFPVETLKSNLIKEIRERTGVPSYYDESGEIEIPPEYLTQRIYCPADDRFPYDPNGKRTGIVFGGFKDEEAKKIKYGIGRWEAEGNKARVELAKEGEIKEYLKILNKSAPEIRFGYKADLLKSYINHLVIFVPEAQEILRALFDKNESKEAAALFNGFLRNNISYLQSEVQDLSEKTITSSAYSLNRTKEKIDKHRNQVLSYKEIMGQIGKIFGSEISGITEEFGKETDKVLIFFENWLAALDIAAKLHGLNYKMFYRHEDYTTDFYKNCLDEIAALREKYQELPVHSDGIEDELKRLKEYAEFRAKDKREAA